MTKTGPVRRLTRMMATACCSNASRAYRPIQGMDWYSDVANDPKCLGLQGPSMIIRIAATKILGT